MSVRPKRIEVTAQIYNTVNNLWQTSVNLPQHSSKTYKNRHIGSIMSIALPHFHHIGVQPADIDFMGHVNNARYLNWVQDAVLAHWNKLAPPETAAKYLWVALKHEITYRKPAFLDDDVIATVVLEKVQGARSFYDTVIKRGEEVLAEVKSSWCCIDAETLRPARIANEIQEYFFPKD
jgi:acyl-CoA thioester hydrolase